MKIIFLLLLVSLSLPAQVSPAPPTPPAQPWLGVKVVRPEPLVYSQVPELPKGVGFLIKKIVKEGPMDQAEVKAHDLLWKMNEQILINEAQFRVLLGMQKVGSKVSLTIIRGGEMMLKEVMVAARPGVRQGSRVLGPERKEEGQRKAKGESKHRVASLDALDHEFYLSESDEEGRKLLVKKEGKVIYDGAVDKADSRWAKPVTVLQGVLDQ